MRDTFRNRRMSERLLITLLALSGLVLFTTSCSSKPAAESVQRTFASPEDAGNAFVAAAKSGDIASMVAIFGPEANTTLFSGDEVKDKEALQGFVDGYTRMHRWREVKAGGQMLYIGTDNYVFPIPLGKNSSGQWYFDRAAGKDEILARRIGKNELTAIAACSAAAGAQRQYHSQTHDGDAQKQYAQQFGSDSGKQNGLYWTAAEGQPPSPLGGLGDFAKAVTNSGGKPLPFNGYYFRIITKQGDQAKGGAKDYLVNGKLTGGFAILAYPAQYRNSGIMTFIVGTDGTVYQKDLGETTPDAAATLAEYNPADGRRPAL